MINEKTPQTKIIRQMPYKRFDSILGPYQWKYDDLNNIGKGNVYT